jgi:hypothetical protein
MSNIDPFAHHEAEHDFDISNPEGRVTWFFQEFWPIIIPASFFLLMCAIPLTLSGMMHNPFSAADSVWPFYGLLLIAEFLLAVVLIWLAPRLLGVYMLVLAIYGLIFAENFKAYTAGFVSDGAHTWMISVPAILFLTYVVIGNLVFMNSLWNENKEKKAALK